MNKLEKLLKHPKFTEALLPEGVRREVQQYHLGRRIVTTVQLYDRNNEHSLIGKGATIRNPKDWSNKVLAEEIATGRAIKDYWLTYVAPKSGVPRSSLDVFLTPGDDTTVDIGNINEM